MPFLKKSVRVFVQSQHALNGETRMYSIAAMMPTGRAISNRMISQMIPHNKLHSASISFAISSVDRRALC